MMQTIPLTQGFVALVSDEDFLYLSQWTWHLTNGYPSRNTEDRSKRLMHQDVVLRMGGVGEHDHKDRDRLNNQRDNLRPATRTQNMQNRGLFKSNVSGLKGVSWDHQRQKWRTRISFERRNTELGAFDSKSEAAKAYNRAARRLYGEFAFQNEIKEDI